MNSTEANNPVWLVSSPLGLPLFDFTNVKLWSSSYNNSIYIDEYISPYYLTPVEIYLI